MRIGQLPRRTSGFARLWRASGYNSPLDVPARVLLDVHGPLHLVDLPREFQYGTLEHVAARSVVLTLPNEHDCGGRSCDGLRLFESASPGGCEVRLPDPASIPDAAVHRRLLVLTEVVTILPSLSSPKIADPMRRC